MEGTNESTKLCQQKRSLVLAPNLDVIFVRYIPLIFFYCPYFSGLSFSTSTLHTYLRHILFANIFKTFRSLFSFGKYVTC